MATALAAARDILVPWILLGPCWLFLPLWILVVYQFPMRLFFGDTDAAFGIWEKLSISMFEFTEVAKVKLTSFTPFPRTFGNGNPYLQVYIQGFHHVPSMVSTHS